MFNRNDKSFFILRKIINVAIIIFMCVCVIAGIIFMALAFGEDAAGRSKFIAVNFIIGIVLLLLGPIICQLIWLVSDMKYNSRLDVKIIRNAQFGLAAPELPYINIFNRNKDKLVVQGEMATYDILKKYKVLVDEDIISQEEFEEIKSQLLNKDVAVSKQVENTIDKIKKLKSYADEKIISTEEFEKEKSKILKK